MIRKIFFILALTLLSNTEEHFGVETDENVLVLTTKNFDEVVNKNKIVMVEFYAPWCGHCKSLAPKYAELAKVMREEHTIPVGKVDATVETELGSRFGIQGYPSLKLFVNGSPIEYKGQRELKDMKEFILKKTQDPSEEVKSVEDLNKLKTDNKVVIVYFGSESEDNFKAFQATALGYDNVKFVHVFDNSMFSAFTAEANSVVLFKQFDEGENRMVGTYTSEMLTKFVEDNRYATVLEFDQEAAEKIFGKEESAIFLFQDSKSDMVEVFTEVAKDKKFAKFNYSTSTVTSGLGARLSEFVGVKASDAPCIRIVQFKNQNLDKFKMNEEFNKENLVKFVEDFHNGKLEKYFKSEPVPETNDDGVKIVVGNNFEKIVLDDSKHVLIKAYAPWCGHCKTLAPLYEQLGEKLKNHADIVIAKIDSTANEYPGFEVQGFPTLKFYKKGAKSTPMDFEGERTVEGMIKFLEKNADLKLDEAKTTSEL